MARKRCEGHQTSGLIPISKTPAPPHHPNTLIHVRFRELGRRVRPITSAFDTMRGWVGTVNGVQRLEAACLVAAVVVTGSGIFFLLTSGPETGTVALVLVLFLGILLFARLVGRGLYRSWFPTLVVVGYVAKLAGAYARYFVVVNVYGTGDAVGYHGVGSRLAEVWRNLQIPEGVANLGPGTRFTQVATGLIFTPYIPTLLGAFFLFATLAYVGQVLFYVAFRRTHPDAPPKLFAAVMLFAPSMLFWPSSVGKESLFMLFMGVFIHGFVDFTQGRWLRGVLLASAGGAGILGVRPHIAALLLSTSALGLLLARTPLEHIRRYSKVGVAFLLMFAAYLALTQASHLLGFGLSATELQEFATEVTEQTNQGGSAIQTDPVSGIADLPAAAVRVLFRPLISDAQTVEQWLSAAENTVVLLLTLWLLPRMIRNRARIRTSAFLAFSTIYIFGFIVAYSAVSNYGILVRQRLQILPFFYALVVALATAPDSPTHETPVNTLVLRRQIAQSLSRPPH